MDMPFGPGHPGYDPILHHPGYHGPPPTPENCMNCRPQGCGMAAQTDSDINAEAETEEVAE